MRSYIVAYRADFPFDPEVKMMSNSERAYTRRSFLVKAAAVAGAATVRPDLAAAFAGSGAIDIDFGKTDGISPDLYGRYLNFAGAGQEFTPGDFQLYQQQLGRLNLVRIWGTTHIDYATQIADEALMVPQMHRAHPGEKKAAGGPAGERTRNAQSFIDLKGLVHGTVSESESVEIAKSYLGAIKAKYPFVTHIEPFNELTPDALDLPHGMTVEEAYYKGFRVTYLAINELNMKNKYAKPLKTGGTACMGPQYKDGYLKNFLKFYARDTDPNKHLGFISVHYYIDDHREIMMSLRKDTEAILAGMQVPVPPLIMSEIGWKEHGAKANDGNTKDALRWATGSMAHVYQVAQQNIQPVQWVYPRKEIRHCMASPVGETPALLPKGNGVKLAQMLKKNQAHSSTAMDGSGNGVYSVASYDESGVAILLFNYDAHGESIKTVSLNMQHFEKLAAKAGRVTEYILDRIHGNWYADKTAWQMVPADSGVKTLSSLQNKSVTLNGNAAHLLLVTFAKS